MMKRSHVCREGNRYIVHRRGWSSKKCKHSFIRERPGSFVRDQLPIAGGDATEGVQWMEGSVALDVRRCSGFRELRCEMFGVSSRRELSGVEVQGQVDESKA